MGKSLLLMGTAAVAALVATGANAQSIKIEDAVARVVFIPEDRSDIQVSVTDGTAGLPTLTVRRNGRDVEISGGLNNGRGRGDMRLDGCRGGYTTTAPSNPGENASVTVRGLGTVQVSDAPLILVRGPRNVKLSANGAVYGAVGRGAEDIELTNAGCGQWVIANVDRDLSLRLAGSGSVWAANAGQLNADLAGSGSLRAGRVRGLTARLAGSGNVEVVGVEGPLRADIAGSGNIRTREGRTDNARLNIAGSGDIVIGGEVHDVAANIAGSGSISLNRPTGNVSSNVRGSGRVRINR